MRYYFSGEYPAAIKINGIYYGILTDTAKGLRIDCDAPFVEICPLTGAESGVNFLLDENFLSSPPPSVTVTDLKGGILIKFYPACDKSEFKIISQQKFPDAVVTVFTENGLKLSIETKDDFYAETFHTGVSDADITRFVSDGTPFIAVCLSAAKRTLYVYRITGKVKKVFCRVVDEFSCAEKFTTVEKFTDMAKHKIFSEWFFDGENFKAKSTSISCDNDFAPENLHEKLIPYAFLEAVAVGADVSCYLCESIMKNFNHLKDFLGEFIGVMPPPKFRTIDEIGLIYRKKENVYSVDYYSFELESGKISNVKKCDD